MTNTYYNAPTAVSRSYSWSTYPVGQCLNWVWKLFDYPRTAGLYDANAAWNSVPSSARRYTSQPPAGVPVYFSGGAHGHICISLGGGKIRSTDWPEKGRVGNTTISYLASRWGMKYRGWSTTYHTKNIANIGGASSPTSYPGTLGVDLSAAIYAHNLRPGYRNNDVKRFEIALWNALGGPYRAKINSVAANKGAVTDGYYGDLTKVMCSDAYAKYGMTRATYPGGTALLKALGFKDART